MLDENGNWLPRKRRWPKVLAVVAGAVLLLVAAGYLYNLYWQHKVEARLASYRALGQPVSWEEVLAERNKLPAEQNSALIFQEALTQIAAQVESPGGTIDLLLRADEPGARPSQRTTELLRTHIKDQAPVLAIIREGATLQTGFYPVNPVALPYAYPLNHLSPLRAAVKLCGREAELRALDGDDAGAVESLVDAHRLSASLGEGWILIEELVRLAGDAITQNAMERALGLCQFSPEGLATLRGELAREQSELTIRPALLGERAEGHYFFTRMSASSLRKNFGGDLGAPILIRFALYDVVPGMRSKDALFYYSVFDPYLALAEMPLRKQAAEIGGLQKELSDKMTQHARDYAISVVLMSGFSRAVGEELKRKVALQVADTALAVEQWRLKHGHWPEALSDLVPEVLKAAPEDPYAGGDMRYLRTERGVTVYSVGPDRTDDGGLTESELPAQARNGPGERGDLPFRLLNPELRGAAQTSLSDEVKKNTVGTQELMKLGISAGELRAAGVDRTDLPGNE